MRVLHVSFHSRRWALGLLIHALLEYLQSNWASHIWETRLLSKCRDTLQIQSVTAASDHVGESARTGILPGLRVPPRNRSCSIEFTDTAMGAGKPWYRWACQLQRSLLCLPVLWKWGILGREVNTL